MAKRKKGPPRKPPEKPLPPAGGWTAAAPLAHPRFDPSYAEHVQGRRLQVLALPDGKVLVRGGHRVDREIARRKGGAHWFGVPVEPDELWDGRDWRVIPAPMADELAKGGRAADPGREIRWSHAAGLDHERRDPCRVALGDGRVLIAGGALLWSTWDGDDAEDCATITVVVGPGGTWQFAGDVQRGRMRGGAVALPDGRVLFAGGEDTSHDAFADVDVWEPMSREQAVAAWARKRIEVAFDRNEKYPQSLKRDFEQIRTEISAWGEEFAPILAEQLTAALPGRRKELEKTLAAFLRSGGTARMNRRTNR